MAQKPSGRTVVSHILDYLRRAIMRELGKGDRRAALNYELAQLTVSNAFFGKDPDPFTSAAQALDVNCEPEPRPNMFAIMAELMKPRPEPPLWVVDGRNGRQWSDSVLAYLQYRSGQAWRPSSHRFHPEYEIYVRAMYEVNYAMNGPGQPLRKPAAALPAFTLPKAA
jgi:hypothetical protein